MGRKLLLNNFSNADGPFLFISSSSALRCEVSGFGYFISNHNKVIIALGCGPIPANPSTMIELQAVQTVLSKVSRNQMHLHHVFTASRDVFQALNGNT